MKKTRLLLAIAFLSLAASACSDSITAPACESGTTCVDPGGNNR